MKNTLLSCILALLSASLYGQEDSIQQRLYGGALVNGYSNSVSKFHNDANILVGAKTDFFLAPGLSFVGRTGYSSTGTNVTNLFFVCAIDALDVSAGFMPRPMGLFKPDPISADAQLALAANAAIPGPATGLAGTLHLNHDSRLMFGQYYLSDGSAEYNASATTVIQEGNPLKLGLGALWGRNERLMFDFLLQGSGLSSLVFCDASHKSSGWADHSEYAFSHSLKVYVDGAYNHQDWTSWEFGVRKEYRVNSISTVLGFGYAKGRTLRSFVMLYL